MKDYVTLEISRPLQYKLSLIRNKHNASKILEYINVLKSEINASDHHIKSVLELLILLSNFHGLHFEILR